MHASIKVEVWIHMLNLPCAENSAIFKRMEDGKDWTSDDLFIEALILCLRATQLNVLAISWMTNIVFISKKSQTK